MFTKSLKGLVNQNLQTFAFTGCIELSLLLVYIPPMGA